MRRYGCTVFHKSWKDRVSVLCRNGERAELERASGAARGAAVGGQASYSLRVCVLPARSIDASAPCVSIAERRDHRVRPVVARAERVVAFLSPSPRRFLHFQGTSNTIYMRDRTTVGSAVWGQQQPPRMRDAPMEHGAHRAPTSAEVQVGGTGAPSRRTQGAPPRSLHIDLSYLHTGRLMPDMDRSIEFGVHDDGPTARALGAERPRRRQFLAVDIPNVHVGEGHARRREERAFGNLVDLERGVGPIEAASLSRAAQAGSLATRRTRPRHQEFVVCGRIVEESVERIPRLHIKHVVRVDGEILGAAIPGGKAPAGLEALHQPSGSNVKTG